MRRQQQAKVWCCSASVYPPTAEFHPRPIIFTVIYMGIPLARCTWWLEMSLYVLSSLSVYCYTHLHRWHMRMLPLLLKEITAVFDMDSFVIRLVAGNTSFGKPIRNALDELKIFQKHKVVGRWSLVLMAKFSRGDESVSVGARIDYRLWWRCDLVQELVITADEFICL